MKTKAYKLAAELGLEETSVLEWLRANGYPNVRRADTIRAEVCQAARKALGRGGQTRRVRNTGRHHSPAPSRQAHKPQPHRGQTHKPQPHKGQPHKSQGAQGQEAGESLSVSFAELIESHMPAGARRAAIEASQKATQKVPKGRQPGWEEAGGPERTSRKPGAPTVDLDMARRLSSAEKSLHDAREAAEGWRVKYQRIRHEFELLQGRLPALEASESRATALDAERSRLALELSTLKQELNAVEGERASLEQTAGELKTALEASEARAAELEQAQAEAQAREKAEVEARAKEKLESAVLRESAWRARALELERSASSAISLGAALQRLGVSELDGQAALLQRMLDHPQSARALIRAVRSIDADSLLQMARDRVARVCVNALCNQVAAHSGLFVLRVDDEASCDICKGTPGRRWFRRMVQECERAGVRRILVIGGVAEVQQGLRELSQGLPVDLRLVSGDETPEPPRVRSRVEGCDVLVVWGEITTSPGLTRAYLSAAQAEGRLTTHIPGNRCSVDALARAVTRRLARHLILSTA